MTAVRNDLLPGTMPSALPPAGAGTGSLHRAAGEFEAMLLNQWLQGAESTFASVPGADNDEDAGDAQMKEFAVQALARGMVAAGGIGLSTMVERNLAKSQTSTTVPVSPASSYR